MLLGENSHRVIPPRSRRNRHTRRPNRGNPAAGGRATIKPSPRRVVLRYRSEFCQPLRVQAERSGGLSVEGGTARAPSALRPARRVGQLQIVVTGMPVSSRPLTINAKPHEFVNPVLSTLVYITTLISAELLNRFFSGGNGLLLTLLFLFECIPALLGSRIFVVHKFVS